MFEQVRNFFVPPVFPEDEDKTRKARYAHVIASGLLAITILYEGVVRSTVGFTGPATFELILIGFALACIAGLWVLKRGYVQLISFLLVALIWSVSNGLAASSYGAKDASYIINFAIILMAGLLLGWQGSLFITLVSVTSGFALAYAEQNGTIKVTSYPALLFVRDVTFVFVLNGVFIFLLITGLENALKKSRSHLKELESANRSLNRTQTELEARTSDLLTANSQLENRTRKLHAIADVTRTATALRSFDDLLSSITHIISNQLGYYHVAIFLLDEQKQFAILRSANTEAGTRMISRGYRLAVGQLEIVSAVAQTGQPRIAFNLNEEKAFSSAPELPDSQSQLALPLKYGNEIIGVLDIQSVQPDEFTETDIATLSILADQVGVALQNALLFEESQRALREANIESLRTSQHSWQVYSDVIQTKGYRYDGIKSEPLKEKKQSSKENEALLIPVQLRGQTIGRLKLNASDRSRIWTEDELLMIKATAERVALALEGARLLDEARKRAERESFLSEVATKLSTSFQLDSILRDTVQELGQSFRNSTVTFQLVKPSESRIKEKSNGNSTNGSTLGANND
jgi:GAF domain-containing protein